MQIIRSLRVEDRASLLHSMFPQEIKQLVYFSLEAADQILMTEGDPTFMPPDLLHKTPLWFRIVRSAKDDLENSWRVLMNDSSEFGKQLFEGKRFLFAFYCLHHFILDEQCKSQAFIKTTHKLFF